jgi:4-hydroxymandelate oxidase
MADNEHSRRQFLAYLAASPLFLRHPQRSLLGHPERSLLGAVQELLEQTQDPPLIPTARHALNVLDFEPVAKAKLPPAHWAYLATGSDDDGTIRANREGFTRVELRVRRLVDVSKLDTTVQLYGRTWPTPILLNPVGSQRAFHPEGELAVARAAKALDHLHVLSTVGTTSYENLVAARGEAPAVWFQLYHRQDWSQTLAMLKRVEKAGCPAVAFTIDLLGGSNRETQIRDAQADTRTCTNCHSGGRPQPGIVSVDFRDNRRKPMLSEFPATPPTETGTPTWDYVKRLKDATSMKVLLKGIVTREDGELAVQHGVDGLFVSNHGGRAENSLRATITSLPDVAQGVNGRIPIIVDGGFRRGTDIFKGLALGATKVGIGRPYIWGLASFGSEGVEVVLALLRRELEIVMRQAGTTSVKRITREYVAAR